MTVRFLAYGRDRLTTDLVTLVEGLTEGLRAPGNHRRAMRVLSVPARDVPSPETFWRALAAEDRDHPPFLTIISGHGWGQGADWSLHRSSTDAATGVGVTAPPAPWMKLRTTALMVNACRADTAADAWRGLLEFPDDSDLILGAGHVTLPDSTRWLSLFLLAVSGFPGEWPLSPQHRHEAWQRVRSTLEQLELSPRSPVTRRFVLHCAAGGDRSS